MNWNMERLKPNHSLCSSRRKEPTDLENNEIEKMCRNESRKDVEVDEDNTQEDIQRSIDALLSITLWTAAQRREYTRLAWQMDSIRTKKAGG